MLANIFEIFSCQSKMPKKSCPKEMQIFVVRQTQDPEREAEFLDLVRVRYIFRLRICTLKCSYRELRVRIQLKG